MGSGIKPKIQSSPLAKVRGKTIDKLYIARYNFDKEGNKIEFKGLKEGESFKDYLRRRYIEEMGSSFEGSEEGIEATMKLYNKWLQELGNPSNVYEANSREANENLLLDTYILVLTDKKNITETRLPLDKVTGIIKDEILPIVDGNVESKEHIPFIEMSPTFQMNKKYEYTGGKIGIGPFALNNKNHVLTQLTNLMFKDNVVLKSLGFVGLSGIKSQNEQVAIRDENRKYRYDSNGSITYQNEEGINILDWISAMINAHVDVAKDPYVIRLNVRQYTYNICNFLLRVGFGKNTFYFLPQSIIKEMALAYERADGVYGVKGGSKTSIVNEEIRKIRKHYYNLYTEACAKSGIPVELDLNANGKLTDRTKVKLEDYAPTIMSRDNLIDSLQNGQSIDNADADTRAKYYKDQLRYSELFLYLNDLAQDMSKLVQLSQIDTKRYGNNFVEQDRFMYRLKSFLNNTSLFNKSDVERYFADTFLLTKAINGMVMPASIFQDVMLRSKQSFKDSVSKILMLLNRENINDESLNKTISNELEGQIRWRFLNSIDGFDLYSMFYNTDTSKSMSQRLAQIKRDIQIGKYPDMITADGKIANRLLNHLTSLSKFSTDNYDAPSIIGTNRVNDTDKFLKQDLKLYWEELLESPHEEIRKFANDLIYYELATTAGNFTKNGIWNLLPVSAILNSGYAGFIVNAVNNFTEADINYNELFLNNWSNSKIVPTIDTQRKIFDEEMDDFTSVDAFPILYGNISINNQNTNVPIILNPTRFSIGKNLNDEPVFTPYYKVVIDKTTPEGILLYKFVGTVKNERDKDTPLYVLSYKKGLNQGGRVVKEYDGFSSSIFDFNNIENALRGNDVVTPESVLNVIKKLGNKNDVKNWINIIQSSFEAINDFIPTTEALNTNLLTIGLNQQLQINQEYQDNSNQGDIIDVDNADQNSAKVFTFKDGTKINIPFALNEQQSHALYVLEDFVNNPKKYNNVITLSGYAGTGKSTLIGIFDKYLATKYIIPDYSAPTHRANAVTKMNNPNAKVNTLHSLFGLSPLVDLTDGKYDLRQLKSVQRNRPKLKDNSTLIIDEASMISKSLFKFIEEYKNNHNVKIIYVGDDAQLSPVNDDSMSPVFTGNQTKLQLTKVERTGDNAILAESTRLRNKQDFSYETRDNVEFTNSSDRANEVIDTIVNSEEFKNNPLYFRILSATNDMISEANDRVRRILFGDNPKQIEVGDIMMGYNNILDPDEPSFRIISNSIDYVVKEVSDRYSKTIEGIKINGYDVRLNEANSLDQTDHDVFVLDNDTSLDTLQKLSDKYKEINVLISQAFSEHEYDKLDDLYKRKADFESSVALMRDFTDSTGRLLLRKSLDYGYAHTIHKSQGGTYNNVLIYANTIDRFQDQQVRQQLKYVAMSRAKDNVTVLTSHPTTGSNDGSLKDRPLTTVSGQFIGEQQLTNPKDYSLYSGGAAGSDTKWGEISNKFGIGKIVHYRPETLSLLTPEQLQEVETAYISSANKLGRKILDANTVVGKLVRRDYLQAKAADAIFAIGRILRPGEKNSKGYVVRSAIPSVDGGTGYAVQMGIDLRKPSHVFDQEYNQWYKFDYDENTFVAEDTPTLIPNFAGVGTRQINDKGINAIEQVFQKTFGSIQAQVSQPNTINIWHSSNENADLSNFAIRPFNYKGYKFDSVEQGFQFAKLGYATGSRNNEIIGNKIMLEKSGAQLRKLGKQIEGLNVKEWDANKYRIMEEMMKASFEQNPNAKQRLLSTGNTTLTHRQDPGEWKTKFPELLMRVRDVLSQPIQEQITEIRQQQNKQTQTFDLTSFATFDESELQSDPDIQELNNKGEQIKNDCKGN